MCGVMDPESAQREKEVRDGIRVVPVVEAVWRTKPRGRDRGASREVFRCSHVQVGLTDVWESVQLPHFSILGKGRKIQ